MFMCNKSLTLQDRDLLKNNCETKAQDFLLINEFKMQDLGSCTMAYFLDVFWTSYVHSIYVLCLWGKLFFHFKLRLDPGP